MSSFDLTPAQALVLLKPNGWQGREAFKATLLWLLAHGHLVAQQVPRGWFRDPMLHLTPGPRAGEECSPDQQSVMDTVQAAATSDIDAIVEAARQRYSGTFEGLTDEHVLPQLAARGLVRQEKGRQFYFFHYTKWVATPSGLAMQRELECNLVEAGLLPRLARREPLRANSIIAALGGLLVLQPHVLAWLREEARLQILPTSEDGKRPMLPALDLGWLDFSGIDFDLSAVGSSLDGSFGDGGDGGGDGGGGGD